MIHDPSPQMGRVPAPRASLAGREAWRTCVRPQPGADRHRRPVDRVRHRRQRRDVQRGRRHAAAAAAGLAARRAAGAGIQVREGDADRAGPRLLSRLPGSPGAGPQLRRHPRLRLRNRRHDAPTRRPAARPVRVLRQRQFFSVLGVPLPLGRGFQHRRSRGRDTRPRRHPHRCRVARRLRRDPSIVGRTMRIGGMDFTIVGVAPAVVPRAASVRARGRVPADGRAPATSSMRTPDVLETRHARVFGLKGRLREG